MNDFCLQSRFNSVRASAGVNSSSRRDEGKIAQGNPEFAAANEGEALGMHPPYKSSPVGAGRDPICFFKVVHAIALWNEAGPRMLRASLVRNPQSEQ
jgi:hypothetical protein